MRLSPVVTMVPADERCREEMAAFALLETLGIPFQRLDHDAADTMEDCAAISEALGIQIYKNLLLCNRQRTVFYLLVMAADKPFHTKDLSHQIGSSRLSFAPAEEMEGLIGCTPGSASILGLMNDREGRVQLLLDREVCNAAYFGCHPCKNDCSLKLKTQDVLERFLPHVGHGYRIVDL